MNFSWTNLAFPATATSVSAQGNNAWAVSSSGDLYRFSSSEWSLQTNLPTTAPFVGVTASTDGSVAGFAFNAGGFLYAYGGWGDVPTPGSGIASVAIGDVDNMIVVDTIGAKHHVYNGIVYPHSAPTGPTKISCTAGLAHMWGVSGSGTVYKWSGSAWTTVSGKFLKQIDVSLSLSNTPQVVGVDAVGNGWMYNSSINSWVSISKPLSASDKFVWIEATRGYIYCALSDGQIYRTILL